MWVAQQHDIKRTLSIAERMITQGGANLLKAKSNQVVGKINYNPQNRRYN